MWADYYGNGAAAEEWVAIGQGEEVIKKDTRVRGVLYRR